MLFTWKNFEWIESEIKSIKSNLTWEKYLSERPNEKIVYNDIKQK